LDRRNPEVTMTKRMAWVVSPSKLCNLRCSYCYEWNELGNPAKMSPELLRSVFVAVRDYHLSLEARFIHVVSNVSWLGGEPLILALDYLEQIMALEEEVLGDLIARGAFYNVVQTNLYQLTDPVIAFLRKHKWKPGISLDVVPGVRLTVGGRETEKRVVANVGRLREQGIQPDAIVVLAKHTTPHVVRLHDFFVKQGFSRVRFLPLFAGPPERPMDSVLATNEEIAEAMCQLFVHWMETGTQLEIEPLQEYLHNILRQMVGVRGGLYDRSEVGEGVLIVNTNGDLYQLLDAYSPDLAMGNVGRTGIEDILSSEATQRTLIRDASVRASMCGPCKYAGTCNGTPALESPSKGDDHGRCAVTHRVYTFIENYLRESGIDDTVLVGMLNTPSPPAMTSHGAA
jgi:uncharacterized protein